MATYNHLSDGRPDGALLGNDAADPVGFHGKAPSAQATFVATVAATVSTSTAVTAINSILAVLIAKGLMAAS
jgi:hypothetical protein